MSKKIIIGLLLSVLIVGQFTTDAYAVYKGTEFSVNYAEPSTSDTQGYINLFLRHNSSGQTTVTTTFWYCIATTNGIDSPCGVYIDVKPTHVKIGPYGSMGATGAYIAVSRHESNGNVSFLHSSNSTAYNESYADWTIIGYKYSGNVAQVNSYIYPNDFFTVYYSEDESAMLLYDLYNLIQSQDPSPYLAEIRDSALRIINQNSNMASKVSNLVTYLKSVDSKMSGVQEQLDELYALSDKMLSEQKESNTWLEKIFNYLNESEERQKEQATQQGNNSVSQGTSSIEDKGAGFVDSMGGLVSSMSYTGTECAWTFPQVKMPAIEGVMEERVLIEEQPIDFTRWINAIPAPILLLIQSVLTMGLIVYCFKELYGTISYVLTLRGGGSNE